jgi:Flp pilus assembly protein TadD
MIMRKIIVCVFLVLTFLCACSESNQTPLYWLDKAKALNYSNQKKAIKYLNKAIKLQPDYADAYNERGIAFTQLGQKQKAIEDFNKAISLNPQDANFYNNRGIVYFQLGQYQRTIDDYNVVIRLKPDNANAYNNRGVSYLQLGNKKLGCRDLQKACALKQCVLLESAKSKGICR